MQHVPQSPEVSFLRINEGHQAQAAAAPMPGRAYMDYSSVCIPVRVSWSLTVAGSDIYDLIRTEFASFLKLNYQFDKMPLQRDAAVRGNVSFKFLRWNGNFAAVSSSISQREAGAFFVPLRLIWISPGLQMRNLREGSSGCLSMRERYAIPAPILRLDMVEV